MENGMALEHGHLHCQCPHGKCLNHGPDWENVGEQQLVPDPGLFGIQTYLFDRCCGKLMARRRVMQKRRCRKCGRIEEHRVTVRAVCLCCGYHFGKENVSFM